tara:strand:+ start:750 stop:1235 length:486 start_codon:yes stop_codon:yes gene_type:complete
MSCEACSKNLYSLSQIDVIDVIEQMGKKEDWDSWSTAQQGELMHGVKKDLESWAGDGMYNWANVIEDRVVSFLDDLESIAMACLHDFAVYTDREQCELFKVPYFGKATLRIEADRLLRSKGDGGYDKKHREFLGSFGSKVICLVKIPSLGPGWWQVRKETK